MGESTRQREAFEAYWRLGSERSIERVAAELSRIKGRAPALRTLYGWSSRYQWQHRLAGLERDARVAADEVRIAALKEMYERQSKAGLLLQQKGMGWLISIETESATAEAAVRAIVEGAKLERIAQGQPGERQEIQSDIEERLSRITDADLERLLRAIAESRVEGEGEAPAG